MVDAKIMCRLTERVKMTLISATRVAADHNHSNIETEDFLRALVEHSKECVAAVALKNLDVNFDRVIHDVINRTVRGQRPLKKPAVCYSAELEEVLGRAARVANEFEHNFIGTEHVVLAIIRQEKNLAARILHDQLVGAERFKEEIMAIVETQQK